VNYERIVVTADNFEWAIRENMQRIDAAMRSKLHVSDARPLGADIALAGDSTIQNVLTSDLRHAAGTYGQALHLTLSAILLIEDGPAVARTEGGSDLRLF
jgi:hypothetical protein